MANTKTYSSEKQYICQTSFASQSAVNRHRRTHTGEKSYACPVCDKGFTNLSNLTRHRRTHTGEKPYICPVCDKGFTSLANLKTHRRLHTGEKPYTCPDCNKGFTDFSNLKRHGITHTEEKAHTCPVCEKGFKELRSLKRHRRFHTGEKTHVCPVCNKGFAELASLKEHRRTNATEKHLATNKPSTKRSDSANHFTGYAGTQPENSKMRSDVIATSSDHFKTVSCAGVFDDTKAFRLKSFGCGICDEFFEREKPFFDHCFGHRHSPPDELFAERLHIITVENNCILR